MSEKNDGADSAVNRPQLFRISTFWREAGTFGLIGVINVMIDLGLFNLFMNGPLEGKVTTAKFLSGGIATVFAWLGNRFWTFRERTNRPVHHEVFLFFAVNAVALLATTGWVAFAHYILDARGSLWINIHAVIGIGIGTIIRFLAYRTIVFGDHAEKSGDSPALTDAESPIQ